MFLASYFVLDVGNTGTFRLEYLFKMNFVHFMHGLNSSDELFIKYLPPITYTNLM
jgi:hypothetical protein